MDMGRHCMALRTSRATCGGFRMDRQSTFQAFDPRQSKTWQFKRYVVHGSSIGLSNGRILKENSSRFYRDAPFFSTRLHQTCRRTTNSVNHTELIDIEAIYRQEHQRWLRDEAPRQSVRDRISQSVPYWIILVANVLYSLSAPHTAFVFDKLTTGWGWIAPVGVEFGLLYAAFRRRVAQCKVDSLTAATA